MMEMETDADHIVGLARLARIAYNGGDLRPFAARLIERISSNENDANALMDLSTVLQLSGQRDQGMAVQALALDIQLIYALKSSAESGGTRLLAIQKSGDLTGNNALEFLVEDSDINLFLLYVRPDCPVPVNLPDHDLAIVAVCQSEQNRPILKQLNSLLKEWPRPVICMPDRIDRLSRNGASCLLRDLPGVQMPITACLDRHTLERIGRSDLAMTDFIETDNFPIIIRPVDSDKGYGLGKILSARAIGDYLEERPEDSFFCARYVDYAGKDGQFRKYRIVLIGGQPFACHMAISSNWMVHYVASGMLENAEKQNEEARFFAGFDEDFARRHRRALLEIASRLELEYVGIDCGETLHGELLIFEIDSGMTVHSMDSPELFPYKTIQMKKVFRAFRQLVIDASDAPTRRCVA